ncbi:P-II family nitrogen regulator [Calothrix sp. UHCC 0171]|uniref:P-II family nitrogen regulator n=1 Tax=Calothrix sp. UHCC 0171 TaxID=3110245 RepID=UPI002B21F64B|nr:P-II family nitrogen regulator [Calothrix sp. UHCC 0171]MEA5573629.1 P-II family nitrogen regulator [Calothrix sp. UHCC 0171]
MLSVKRMEIIANYVELGKILDGLEKSGIEDYTVIRDVAGKSTREDGKHDLAMTMLDNIYIIAFCKPEKIAIASEAIRAILNKYGGSCFISDAMELRTIKCVG